MTVCIAKRVGRSFERSANSYHDGARVQARIARDLSRRLALAGAPSAFRHGFEIGCGSGHLTHAVLDRFMVDRLVLNDLVPAFASVAEQLRAGFLPGDARGLKWPHQPDLILSASTLQWMDDPGAMLRRMAVALAPAGWLAVSSFGPRQFCELQSLGCCTQAPGLRDPTELASGLPQGIDVMDVGQSTGSLWFADPRDVLRHLRRTGVNAAASQIWTRAKLNAFCERYADRFATPRGVPLTYHATWVIARKLAR